MATAEWADHASACIEEVRTATGDLAWHVMCYDLVRGLLTDSRLGFQHPNPEEAARIIDSPMSAPLGLTSTPEATVERRRRKLLSSIATARRVEHLAPKVQAAVDEVLDELERDGSGKKNFHDLVSVPLPIAVVSALLGLPPEDRPELSRLVLETTAVARPAETQAAIFKLHDYVRGLLDRRHLEPRDDFLSVLADEEARTPSDINREQPIDHLATLVLIAGSVTTTAVIDHGLALFLTHPDQQRFMLGSEEAASVAIEELLRFPSFRPSAQSKEATGLIRYAKGSFQIADALIQVGDLVILNNRRACLDAERFPEPTQFDCQRTPNPHLSFGHGMHICPGANLARLELRTLFTTLFTRFPQIRLAVPPDQLFHDARKANGALVWLPVSL